MLSNNRQKIYGSRTWCCCCCYNCPNIWYRNLIIVLFLNTLLLLNHSSYAFQSLNRQGHQHGHGLVFVSRIRPVSNPPFGSFSRINPVSNTQQRQQQRLQPYYRRYIPSEMTSSPSSTSYLPPLQAQRWDGDDMRWTSRWKRRIRRAGFSFDGVGTMKKILTILNVAIFLYQIIWTVIDIKRTYPSYWPNSALEMISDAIMGTSTENDLLLNDFAFSVALSQKQPHRYLTSGFIHGGGIFHLLVSLGALLWQPSWLETGLGAPLYLTTFLTSIISGNIAHVSSATPTTMATANSVATFRRRRALSSGCTGGISGLYGLMFVALMKMKNAHPFRETVRGMGAVLVIGSIFRSIGDSSHYGGFFGGFVIGILCLPSYGKSYSLRRKDSVDYDSATRGYRRAMGFGIRPTGKGLVPLPLLWGGMVLITILSSSSSSSPMSTFQQYLTIPWTTLNGLLHPGSLSA